MSDEHTLQCMEVWGGNRAVNNGVVMMGVDAWVFCRPFGADEAGGDVHYVSSCASGRIVRLIVADVAGHGASVAELATRLRGLMRSYANYVDQREVVGVINREFGQLADLGKFATAIAATYWTPTDELVMTNAGHPPPLRYQAATGAWTPAVGPETDDGDTLTNIPLGLVDRTAYDEVRLRLRTGDLVLFYTDGVIESRDPDGSMLGEAGLIAMLAELDASQPQDLVRALVERLDARGDAATDDDVTLVLIGRNANKPRVSLVAGIVTIARLAREMARSLFRRDTPFPWPEMTWRNMAGAFIARVNRP